MVLREQLRDVFVSLIVIGLGVVFYILTLDLSPPSDIFPRLVITILIFLGVLLFLKSLFIKKAYQKEREEEGHPEKVIGGGRKWLGVITLFVLVYLIPVLGFYVTSLVFLILFSWYLGGARKKISAFFVPIVMAFCTTLVIYAAFDVFLNVPIPDGVLF
ncbi:tripartite tricarboxylate transporter TctB family protein [Bacillus sp. FJAT-44742]|uniref:tripartite tricarboxylate transporter TctB family protein n=1 Tax=Bacillus sp. FJAT-44742 TaxID=2014005 RepID=UPI0012FEC424|nr:tripartite tricarboxylate transporter TctB family protein [Bacillus sp. FJAT-44742]